MMLYFALDVPNHPFSTAFSFIHLVPCKLTSKGLKFMGSQSLYAKPFSSIPNDDDNLTMVESECDFDADVGKRVELHSVDENCSCVGNSRIVELENVLNDCVSNDYMVSYIATLQLVHGRPPKERTRRIL